MALLDALNYFDTGAALTVSRASTFSIEVGGDVSGATFYVPDVEVAFTTLPAGAGATINIQVQTSTDDATWTTLIESGALPVNSFTSNKPSSSFLPKLPAGVEKYIQLNYVIAGGPLTAGAVTAKLSGGRAAMTSYPSGYTAP
jgi:hypothetical protein